MMLQAWQVEINIYGQLSNGYMCMQAQEVRQHEPDCRIYFAMTKCDLLDHPPGIGKNGSNFEPSPQESGTQHTLMRNYHSSDAHSKRTVQPWPL